MQPPQRSLRNPVWHVSFHRLSEWPRPPARFRKTTAFPHAACDPVLTHMQTRILGTSDLAITPIGFGAWAIGGGEWEFGWGAQDDEKSIAAIHRALELGINWIDTAAVYGLGHSEEIVARALRDWSGPRPYVFTKCGMPWNAAREVGYSLREASIRSECEASLRRLGVEAIDLYQIHWPADDLEETKEGWSTLAALQREGKVRWIGVVELQCGRTGCRTTHRAHHLAPAAVFPRPPRCGRGAAPLV